MATKKKNSIVIDLTTVKNTLKAFTAEIKTKRKAINAEYVAIQKKESDLWKLEDQARDLEQIVELGKTFKAVAA